MKFLFIFVGLSCELSFIYCQSRIPEVLKECYTKNFLRDESLLPMNFRTFLDIIQKAERYSYPTLNMRMFVTSLLHRFKLDGIQYFDGMPNVDGIIPYAATGTQRIKHKLMEDLIPHNHIEFPVESLSLIERCTLHKMVSNAIVLNFPADEMNYSTGNYSQKIKGKPERPQEQGVIRTAYETLTPGSVLEAIAASLQHQNIPIKQILTIHKSEIDEFQNFSYMNTEAEIVVPRHLLLKTKLMWYENSPDSNIDNIWLSTVSGDLAELVIHQGSYRGTNLSIGSLGSWDNLRTPKIYYLTEFENFDFTRAELIGDIDGLIIGSNLLTWLEKNPTLRLSQLLEMYYSRYGVNFDPNYGVCSWKDALALVNSKTILKEQTYAISYALSSLTAAPYMTNKVLQNLSDAAVEKFLSHIEKNEFNRNVCLDETTYRVEMVLAFDGSSNRDTTTDYIHTLVDELNICLYGSKMGILHGTSGQWLLNVTNSPANIYHATSMFEKITWPQKINILTIFERVFEFLNETKNSNEEKRIIGNMGQGIILLVRQTFLSEDEIQSSLSLLKKIKYIHPDVHFFYDVTSSNIDSFKPFLLTEEDHLVETPFIFFIAEELQRIPFTIVPTIESKVSSNEKRNSQFEDYITPPKSVTYKLNTHWKQKIKKIIIEVHGFDYGQLNICTWVQNKFSNTKPKNYCQILNGNSVVNITDYPYCESADSCLHRYIRVQAVQSLRKCTEIDCRYRDQLRYIITANTFSYNSTVRCYGQIIYLILAFIFYFVIS